MSWSLVASRFASFADAVLTTVTFRYFGDVSKGDLLVMGIATAPDVAGYVVTDNTSPSAFSWVFTSAIGFASSAGGLGLAYGVASHNAHFPRITVASVSGGGAVWQVSYAIYHPTGVAVSDGASVGRGTGTDLAGSVLSPTGTDELAYAVGASLGIVPFVGADAPLTDFLAPVNGVVLRMATADNLSISSPFTPTMHLGASSSWGILAALFGELPLPVVPYPGSFLGSGLEPFPMRRQLERREDSIINFPRNHYRTDLIK